MDDARCPRCGKRLYRTWSDAAHDCRSIRRHVKRSRTLHVYWSRRCSAFHLTNERSRRRYA